MCPCVSKSDREASGSVRYSLPWVPPGRCAAEVSQSETGVEVNSKPISNSPPLVALAATQCTMRLAAPLTAERRRTRRRNPGTTSETAPYFPLSYKATRARQNPAPTRQYNSGPTHSTALDAPMHHETSRRRPSRRPACTPQEISPPPVAPTRRHHRPGPLTRLPLETLSPSDSYLAASTHDPVLEARTARTTQAHH